MEQYEGSDLLWCQFDHAACFCTRDSLLIKLEVTDLILSVPFFDFFLKPQDLEDFELLQRLCATVVK